MPTVALRPVSARVPMASLVRRAAAWGMVALVLAAASPVCEARQRSGSLDSRVSRALSEAKLGPTRLAVAVMDVSSGTMLASVNERAPLIPASNLKLLTSGTALLVLGKDFEFRTGVFRQDAPEGSRVIVRGSGDPGFADHELLEEMKLGADEFLDRLAAPVIESFKANPGAGVREVVLDDRVFDREAYHPTWPANQFNEWYCAEVSGLNFHANVLELYVEPGAVGRPPLVRRVPDAPWMEVRNNARTVGSREQQTVGATRAREENRFTLMGDVPRKLDVPIRVTMNEPALVLGRLLGDRLTKAGVAHAEGLKVRMANAEEAIEYGTPLFVVRTPLERVLRRCNVNSHNLHAESLLKRVGNAVTGQPGSWSNGTAVVRMQVAERLGASVGNIEMSDGCGLSPENKVTALLMVSWLRSLASDPSVGAAFVESMASQADGRLAERFRDANLRNELRAKTGFINGVLALSGYVTDTTSGRRIAFSVIANTRPATIPASEVRKFTDSVVKIIDDHLVRQAQNERREPAMGG
jgi:D-alanyl-D-alanine carboxypeptidase/D-alanyl-D-alanine-endopeptidase (penicillin-binding protein 4)